MSATSNPGHHDPVTRYVAERDLRGALGTRLLRWLLDHDADEFSITVMALQDTQAPFADAFEDELGPFERPPALRRVPFTDGQRVVERRARLWTLDAESLQRLMSFRGENVFHCEPGPDGWLEDLVIYRRGEIVLALASDHREGVLRLTQDEHAGVATLGIASRSCGEWLGTG